MRRTAPLLALLAVLALSACGSGERAAAPTLEEWREDVCAVFSERQAELNATATNDDPEQLLAAMRTEIEALDEAAAELERLEPPGERREQAESFVRLFREFADDLRRLLPRIEEAQRRFDEALESGDLDALPSAEELEPLFGPEETVDAAESERLGEELGLTDCTSVGGG